MLEGLWCGPRWCSTRSSYVSLVSVAVLHKAYIATEVTHALHSTTVDLQGIGDIEEVQMGDGSCIPCIKCPWHSYPVSLRDGQRLYQSLDLSGGTDAPGDWKRYATSCHAVLFVHMHVAP
jgi:hypothetical protein